MMNIRRSARVAARIVAAAGMLALGACHGWHPAQRYSGYDANDAMIEAGVALIDQSHPAWRPPVICNTMRTGYGTAQTICN